MFCVDLGIFILTVSSKEIMFNHIYKNLLSDEPNKIISELILKYFNINVNDYKLFVFDNDCFYYYGFTNFKK